ncbi:DUF3772 domain-containing protein [Roseovarius sp. TE539]|uniref:DUF3772 domain-containing protein n=1 Tax=Roseovarius sp. TE539 TaxID=2249812 RepID=UPI000DDDD037|nr:DUF3772 domain-containing protein [Roseovarius sp. TE539]RBI74721.1 DUF3772 domain-containing protein [Roseovarius sp. TE539]
MKGTVRTLLLCVLLALTAATALPDVITPDAAHAQQPPEGPNYETWDLTADRATEAIEAARASTPALEELRNQLVDWRERFLGAQDANTNAIETVEAQLEALGAPPEEGTEAPDISKQRAQLNERLGELRAPVKRAEAAYSQADGLIKGIDRIIRERQTEELTELGPSPLNPAHWSTALNAPAQTFRSIRSEVIKALETPSQQDKLRQNMPLAVVLLVLGLVLMLRGRYWVERLVGALLGDNESSARWIITLVISLGEIAVPYLGLRAAIEAFYTTGLVGLRGDQFLSALHPAVLIFLVARWLTLRCFPRLEQQNPPLDLDQGHRRSGRLCGGALALVIALFYLLRDVSEFAGWPPEAQNVIIFPVMVVAGLLLLRLANLVALHSRTVAGSDELHETYRNRLTRLMSRVLVLLAVVAPLLAAVGYVKAAQALMLPSLLSLLMLAALLVMQRIVGKIYSLATGDSDGAADDLVPVLAGFVLVLVSLPVFALIWGARVADLTELWSTFIKGVTIGGLRLSPTIFLTLAVVFTLGYVLTRLLQGTLANTVLPKTRLDTGGRNAIVSGVGYVGIFLAALIAITSAGIDLSSLAIVAGALSVGIGFGLQNIVSNFVSGIILLIERPISEGDWIEVGGQHGYVRSISVRSTRIETFDRTDVIVPNADLISGTVTNYTRGNTVGRVIVPVGVAYGTDTTRVEKILQEIGEAHPMVLANPEPYVVFQGFGADALQFEIRAILRDVNWVLNVKSDMNHQIARRFAEEGIEIPFAQRDVWLRNPEVLNGASSAAGPAPDEGALTRRRPVESDLSELDGDGGDT